MGVILLASSCQGVVFRMQNSMNTHTYLEHTEVLLRQEQTVPSIRVDTHFTVHGLNVIHMHVFVPC